MIQEDSIIKRYCLSVFGLDIRSLALFRILAALLLLVDLAMRASTLIAMYSDDGVLPRPMLTSLLQAMDDTGLSQWGSGSWSIHSLSGAPEFQITLFVIAWFFAVLMLAGCFTRVATFVSWFLLLSLQNRNCLVLTSGDTIFMLVMMWSIFLPLNRVWSVDAWRRSKGRLSDSRAHNSDQIVSFASAGFIIQLAIMYFCSGLAKWNEIWFGGQALNYVFQLDIYTTPFAESLLKYTELNRLVGIATVLAEFFLPWLLLIPWKNAWWRILNLIVFCGMHISILLTLSIGLFGYICIAIWMALLPGGIWNWLLGKNHQSSSEHHSPPSAKSVHIHGWSAIGHGTSEIICAAMLLFVLAWNVANYFPSAFFEEKTISLAGRDITRHVQRDHWATKTFQYLGQATGLSQQFVMFGVPPSENAWFVFRAQLVDGSTQDVFLGGRLIPEYGAMSGPEFMPNFHWRKYLRNLTFPVYIPFRQRVAGFMAEQWNESHSEQQQIVFLELECYLDIIGPNPVPGELRGMLSWGTYPR